MIQNFSETFFFGVVCTKVVLVFILYIFCVTKGRHFKNIHEFSGVPFKCIFNDFSFLLDISSKINLHVWFYFVVFFTILYVT